MDKLNHLRQIIKALPSSAVAFSGGVDSALLASILLEVQGEQALALTVDSVFASRTEMEDAINFAAEIGIDHQLIRLDHIDESVLANPVDRCYHCKKMIFGKLLTTAQAQGRSTLLDGSNLDDLDDYRPGMKAIEELGVKSPFLEARLTKAEIRKISQTRGLSTWNKPSMACLASRIPHHDTITSESLRMVETAEQYLISRGLNRFRVRKHGNLARIEVSPEERPLFFNLTVMEEISSALKNIGFRFVSLDLEGYHTGSLN